MMILLQAAPTPEQIEAKRDSIRAGAKMMIETAKSDPETFWQEVGTATLHFGIKVLAALLIFVIGILLIRWIKHLLKKAFENLIDNEYINYDYVEYADNWKKFYKLDS